MQEKFKNHEADQKPQIFDESWYPTTKTIQNHMYMTSVSLKLSQLDQVNLEEHIRKWEAENDQRKFYMRCCKVDKSTLIKEEEEKRNNQEKEVDDDDDEEEGDTTDYGDLNEDEMSSFKVGRKSIEWFDKRTW